MKNIGASVSVILTQGKKTAVEEEYTWKTNEMIFYLQGNPECLISAVGEWHGNTAGEVIGDVDIYFRHFLTGKRCESVWDAIRGYECFDDRWADAWEKLAALIEDIPNLEKTVCTERSTMLLGK